MLRKIIKQKNILYLLSYVAIALFSLRGFLLSRGTLGHSWDWSIPPTLIHLQALADSLFYTWRSFSLGEPISLWLPSAPFFFILTLPSRVGIAGDFISKASLVFIITLSGYGMFLFLKFLLEEHLKKNQEKASFLGGVFYALSPFLFSEIIGGAITQLFSYSLIPWFFLFLKKLNAAPRNFFLSFTLLVLTLSFITTSLQNLLIVAGISFLYTFIQNNKTVYFCRLVFLYLCYSLINLFWLIPSVIELRSIQATISSGPPFSYFTIQNLVPSLVEAIASVGYARPFYTQVIGEGLLPYWFFIIFLFLIFILWRTFSLGRKESFFWLSVFLISLVFATGGKEPYGNQVVWLYEKFYLMSFFRSPQHFIVLPTFAFSIVLAFGLSRLDFKNNGYQLIFIIPILIWLFPFYFFGDLGAGRLQAKKMEFLESFVTPPDYYDLFDFLKKDKEDFKVLFLPPTGSPAFLLTEYQKRNQGGDPLVVYSPWDTVVSDISYGTQARELISQIEMILCGTEERRDFSQALSLMNIKYLIFRKDVAPHFTECKTWDQEKVKSYLDNHKSFAQVKDGKYVTLYRNTMFLPHLYLSQKILPSDVFQSVVFGEKSLGNGVFMEEDIALINYQDKPSLSFRKVNPTQYSVVINELKHPSLLIFSESFNNGWRLIKRENEKIFNFKAEGQKHFKVNTFSNAWVVEENGEYLLEYLPQKYFYLGSMISLLSLSILLFFSIKSIGKWGLKG